MSIMDVVRKLAKGNREKSEKFKEMGYELKDEVFELAEIRADIAEKILNFKLKNIQYFSDDEGSSYVGFTLEDVQVVFHIEIGEDEEGPWYEASVEILNFGDED